MRLETPLELKDNYLLNLGESFIIVNLIDNCHNLSSSTYDSKETEVNSKKLRLKLFGGP